MHLVRSLDTSYPAYAYEVSSSVRQYMLTPCVQVRGGRLGDGGGSGDGGGLGGEGEASPGGTGGELGGGGVGEALGGGCGEALGEAVGGG